MPGHHQQEVTQHNMRDQMSSLTGPSMPPTSSPVTHNVRPPNSLMVGGLLAQSFGTTPNSRSPSASSMADPPRNVRPSPWQASMAGKQPGTVTPTGTQGGPMAGPPTGFTGQPTGLTGPPTGLTGPPTGLTGPPTTLLGPQTGFRGPATGFTRPSTSLAGPPTALAGPQTGFRGPSTNLAGAQTGMTGPPTSLTGSQTSFTGPPTSFTRPPTSLPTTPTGQAIGSTGQPLTPGSAVSQPPSTGQGMEHNFQDIATIRQQSLNTVVLYR